MFDVWFRAITQPSQDTYEGILRAEHDVTLSKAAGWMALAGLIAGIIQGLLSGGAGILCAPVFAVLAAIFFAIYSLILLVIARALGGEGELDSQSYLLAAAQAPMTIISAILGFLPWLGLLANLYTLWLNALALQAAHGYSLGRALLTVLIPVIVVLVLVMGCFLTLAPSISDVLEEIEDSLEEQGALDAPLVLQQALGSLALIPWQVAS
jgi:hypothetical protein